VDRWISVYNGGVPGLDASGAAGLADIKPYGEEDELDLAEAFGLPDRLPPLRLPEDDELAEAARATVLLNRALTGQADHIDGPKGRGGYYRR
jgi:hypothetical protein